MDWRRYIQPSMTRQTHSPVWPTAGNKLTQL